MLNVCFISNLYINSANKRSVLIFTPVTSVIVIFYSKVQLNRFFNVLLSLSVIWLGPLLHFTLKDSFILRVGNNKIPLWIQGSRSSLLDEAQRIKWTIWWTLNIPHNCIRNDFFLALFFILKRYLTTSLLFYFRFIPIRASNCKRQKENTQYFSSMKK